MASLITRATSISIENSLKQGAAREMRGAHQMNVIERKGTETERKMGMTADGISRYWTGPEDDDMPEINETEELEDDELDGSNDQRYAECQSQHSGGCYGPLWQCKQCGKTTCCAEGSDNKPDLCNDCWSTKHEDKDELAAICEELRIMGTGRFDIFFEGQKTSISFSSAELELRARDLHQRLKIFLQGK